MDALFEVATVYTYVARGFTDDVTDCDHCGRTDLKGTVRILTIDQDGNEHGEQYMGTTCAAKMSGRTVKDINTEARVADQDRRNAWRTWTGAHSDWFCAYRDAVLPAGFGFADLIAMRETPEFLAAEAAWYTTNPAPEVPAGSLLPPRYPTRN